MFAVCLVNKLLVSKLPVGKQNISLTSTCTYYNYNVILYKCLQLLEYTGRGKSIIDVGLAQARSPLDTTNHYFEIEVADPGENCYIAIGLARRVSCKLLSWM